MPSQRAMARRASPRLPLYDRPQTKRNPSPHHSRPRLIGYAAQDDAPALVGADNEARDGCGKETHHVVHDHNGWPSRAPHGVGKIMRISGTRRTARKRASEHLLVPVITVTRTFSNDGELTREVEATEFAVMIYRHVGSERCG